MNAFEVLFTLVLVRLVLPVGALVLIREWMQTRRRSQLHRR